MRIERTNFELDFERDRELMYLFKQVMASKDFTSIDDVLEEVVNSPSSRFWVTETRAWKVIIKMLKGKNPHIELASKRAMYEEIYNRVLDYRMSHPRQTITKIVREVVHQQAPKFYLSKKRAEMLIYKARQREKANRKKLFGLFTLRSKKDPDFEMLEKHVEGSRGHID